MTKTAMVAILLTGCVNADNVIGQCRDVARQAENGAWDRCTAFYEDEVIPEIKAASQVIEANILQGLGCVRKGTGWDCSGICASAPPSPPPPNVPWHCANGICVPGDPNGVWSTTSGSLPKNN